MADNTGITTAVLKGANAPGTNGQDGQTRKGEDAADYEGPTGPVGGAFASPPNRQAAVRTNPDVGAGQQSPLGKQGRK
jgi:hypothetical protein